jgi:hypothetical protein
VFQVRGVRNKRGSGSPHIKSLLASADSSGSSRTQSRMRAWAWMPPLY